MKKEVLEKVSELVIAAFGLVAAFAWRDAVQGIFAAVFGEKGGLIADIVYAVIVTIVAVLVAIHLGKMAPKAK